MYAAMDIYNIDFFVERSHTCSTLKANLAAASTVNAFHRPSHAIKMKLHYIFIHVHINNNIIYIDNSKKRKLISGQKLRGQAIIDFLTGHSLSTGSGRHLEWK